MRGNIDKWNAFMVSEPVDIISQQSTEQLLISPYNHPLPILVQLLLIKHTRPELIHLFGQNLIGFSRNVAFKNIKTSNIKRLSTMQLFTPVVVFYQESVNSLTNINPFELLQQEARLNRRLLLSVDCRLSVTLDSIRAASTHCATFFGNTSLWLVIHNLHLITSNDLLLCLFS